MLLGVSSKALERKLGYGELSGPFAAAGLSYCTVSKGNPKYQQCLMGWLVFLLFLGSLLLTLRCLPGRN